RFAGRLPLYGQLMEAVAAPLYRALGLASGCFLFCTRAAFDAVGGFDEGLFGRGEAPVRRRPRPAGGGFGGGRGWGGGGGGPGRGRGRSASGRGWNCGTASGGRTRRGRVLEI